MSCSMYCICGVKGKGHVTSQVLCDIWLIHNFGENCPCTCTMYGKYICHEAHEWMQCHAWHEEVCLIHVMCVSYTSPTMWMVGGKILPYVMITCIHAWSHYVYTQCIPIGEDDVCIWNMLARPYEWWESSLVEYECTNSLVMMWLVSHARCHLPCDSLSMTSIKQVHTMMLQYGVAEARERQCFLNGYFAYDAWNSRECDVMHVKHATWTQNWVYFVSCGDPCSWWGKDPCTFDA
jgi:hypothetical protein